MIGAEGKEVFRGSSVGREGRTGKDGLGKRKKKKAKN